MASESHTELVRAAQVVQLALTPVFLLSGIAALLNVFSQRLARVADQVDRLQIDLEDMNLATREKRALRLAFLSRRSHVLDVAVVLGTLAGVATSGAALALFTSALVDAPIWLLYASFAAALLCTVGALAAYLVEMLMASRGIRQEAKQLPQSNSRSHAKSSD